MRLSDCFSCCLCPPVPAESWRELNPRLLIKRRQSLRRRSRRSLQSLTRRSLRLIRRSIRIYPKSLKCPRSRRQSRNRRIHRTLLSLRTNLKTSLRTNLKTILKTNLKTILKTNLKTSLKTIPTYLRSLRNRPTRIPL